MGSTPPGALKGSKQNSGLFTRHETRDALARLARFM
jgi:hypothetical protein